MGRHVAANALTFLILGLIVVYGLINWGARSFERDGPLAEATVFEVGSGWSFGRTVEELSKAGAISNETIYRLNVRYGGLDQVVKAGEYEIPAAATMREVHEIVTSGVGIQLAVTIPEGFTSWEVVQRLNAQDELTGEIEEIPPEGSLAPNTYSFSRGATRQSVLNQMATAQERIVTAAWEARDAELPIASDEEMLILASIIEREAGGAEEWRKVASVFVNRLNRGMMLQADATVRYGITLGREKLGRGLRRSELDRDTPYNSYTRDGLPPTPIANPGKAAIEATVTPEETNFLYFVADGTGGHAFAETLDQHLENVAAWRRIEAERAAAREAE